mmetsp:Transcript_24180/g.36776  ORF Transcript_24180/g.36776 Transcript_24180/m.36776 type:complete len:268 (-) Transcript_24180:2-805(-)
MISVAATNVVPSSSSSSGFIVGCFVGASEGVEEGVKEGVKEGGAVFFKMAADVMLKLGLEYQGSSVIVVVEEEEEIPPLELLLENKKLTMVDIINPVECNEWIGKREQYGDLFDQRGLWSTVYIETPDVDFHIELRQSNPNNSNRPCKFQSLDVWMTRVSPKLQQEDWYGILGETKIPKLNEQTGEPILRDRYHILSSPRDEDYEVEGPYGTEFVAGPPVTNHQKGFLWTSLWKTSNNNHNNKIIKKQPQPQQLSGGGGGGGAVIRQ